MVLKAKKGRDKLVCGYNSRKFKPNEINYITYDKEFLAIKNGIKIFHIYLAPEKFIIRIDNQVVKDFLKS